MIQTYRIKDLERSIRVLIILFTITLSIGFFTGISFVHFTTSSTTDGITENYQGNEDDEDAEIMKFKKSRHQMLNILHTHFLSMSLIFFILALLVYGCDLSPFLKQLLMIEPMISVILTFGGIFLVWKGIAWMSYLVLLSGTLMTLSFSASAFLIIINALSYGWRPPHN
jgi:hypothetical protein